MKSTAMIRSLLDPVCRVKVRVHNIRKLNVRYGYVFAFEAVLIIIIYNLGWLEGCQCSKRSLVHLQQVLHPPDPAGGGHRYLKLVQVVHISDLTLCVSVTSLSGYWGSLTDTRIAVQECSARQGYRAGV